MKKKLFLPLLSMLLSAISAPSYPTVTTDRTRVVFNADSQAVALGIENTDKKKPYLAQIWLEDEQHHKLKDIIPLIAVPPVIRMEPGSKNRVRINKTAQVAALPTNRETLFYLNVRGIPPKHAENNSLQVALQTSLKVFYRPESIKLKWGEFVGDRLILKKTKTANEIVLNNPTPYYFTVAGMSLQKNDKNQDNFETFMIAPYSQKTLKRSDNAGVKSYWFTLINDFGARNQLEIPLI